MNKYGAGRSNHSVDRRVSQLATPNKVYRSSTSADRSEQANHRREAFANHDEVTAISRSTT